MKLFLSIALFIILLNPIRAFAMPEFPMAFWGTVKLNGENAPVGTVVRAYYNTTLAGETTISEPGIYGYNDATKQKLLIGEGTGVISFTIQSTAFNNGAETGGDTPQTYPQFTAGETHALNLSFQKETRSRSGGGGGGGSRPITTSIPATPTVSTITPISTGGCAPGNKFSTTTGTPCAVENTQQQITVVQSTDIPTFTTSITRITTVLKNGSKGSEVMELQKLLTAKGYGTLTADGAFGPMTRAAVMRFQISNRLIADGVVGPMTRLALSK